MRSLSELPGHLRVPVLRRKDTERTQARLEAGAAGVEELRALREQQQHLMDETMAVTMEKRKQFTRRRNTNANEQTDYQQGVKEHPGKQIQGGDSFSSIPSWHSTCSLASISEELDTPAMSSNTISQEESMDACRSPHHQEFHHSGFHYNQEYQNQQQSLKIQQQLHRTVLSRSHELISMFNKEKNNMVQTGNRKFIHCDEPCNALATHDNRCLPKNMDSIKNYIQFEDGSKMHTPACLKQRTLLLESEQQFLRGRSQSINETYQFSVAKEREFEICLPNKNNVEKLTQNSTHSNKKTASQSNKAENYQQLHQKTNLTTQITSGENQNTTVKSHITIAETQKTTSNNNFLGHKHFCSSYYFRNYGKPSVHYFMNMTLNNVPLFSPHSRNKNKSISWDNLLITIGLTDQKSLKPNEAPDEGNESSDNEMFLNSALMSEENTKRLIENSEIILRNKTRSHSFTAGYSGHPSFKSELLKKENLYHNSNMANWKQERVVSEVEKQASGPGNTASIVRRASIQCDEVLTKTISPRKIINPLHGVDIRALQTPGPLHAVTLQYNNILPRRLSGEYIATSHPGHETRSTPQYSSISNLELGTSKSSHESSKNLQTTLQTASPSATFSNVEQVKCISTGIMETSNSKMLSQANQKNHCIVKPRTSFSKQIVCQQGTQHTNCGVVSDASKDGLSNKAAEGLNNNTSSSADWSEPAASERILLQGIEVMNSSGLHSDSVIKIKETEPDCHKLTQNKIRLDNSVIKQAESLTEDIIKVVKSNICDSTMPTAAELNSSIKESRKALGKNTINVQKQTNNDKKDLTARTDRYSLEKAIPNVLDADNVTSHSIGRSKNNSGHTLLAHAGMYQACSKSDSKTSDIFAQCSTTQQRDASDVSVLSDEGYSTCDSISFQPQPVGGHGHCQSSEMSSLKNDSIASRSSLRESYSPQKLKNDIQIQVESPQLKSSISLNSEAKMKHNHSNINPENTKSREEILKVKTVTNSRSSKEGKIFIPIPDSALHPKNHFETGISNNRLSHSGTKTQEKKNDSNESEKFVIGNNKTGGLISHIAEQNGQKQMYEKMCMPNAAKEKVIVNNVAKVKNYNPNCINFPILNQHMLQKESINSIENADCMLSQPFRQTAV